MSGHIKHNDFEDKAYLKMKNGSFGVDHLFSNMAAVTHSLSGDGNMSLTYALYNLATTAQAWYLYLERLEEEEDEFTTSR